MMRTLDDLIGEHPFFEDMEDDARHIIAGCASKFRVQAGEWVYRRGELADHFYLIRHGLVCVQTRVSGHEPVVVETLGDGDILGWCSLVPPYAWRFDVLARQTTRLVSIDAICLRQKCGHDRGLGCQVYQRFLPVIAHTVDGQRHTMLELLGVAREEINAPT